MLRLQFIAGEPKMGELVFLATKICSHGHNDVLMTIAMVMVKVKVIILSKSFWWQKRTYAANLASPLSQKEYQARDIQLLFVLIETKI